MPSAHSEHLALGTQPRASSSDLWSLQAQLQNNGDIAARDAATGRTLLHLAAAEGCEDLVRWLMGHGALWSTLDFSSCVPADLAREGGHSDVYELLRAEAVRDEYFRRQYRTGTSRDGDALVPRHTISGPTEQELQNDDLEGIADAVVSYLWKDAREQARCLVIGYGDGAVANALNSRQPAEMVILESDGATADRLRESKQPNLVVVQAQWNAVFAGQHQLGKFDMVYLNTPPSYSDLITFFRHIPSLLRDANSTFSFSHQPPAASAFVHDVFREVPAWQLNDIGMCTSWHALKDGSVHIPVCALAPTVPRLVVQHSGWVAGVTSAKVKRLFTGVRRTPPVARRTRGARPSS